MKTNILLVLTAVLMTGTAQATETLLSCWPSEKTVEEATDKQLLYSFQAQRTFSAESTMGQFLIRAGSQPKEENKPLVSNLLNIGAKIVDGNRCEITFAHVRDKMDCTAHSPKACSFETMKVTLDPEMKTGTGYYTADFYYQMPKTEVLGFDSQPKMDPKSRALECIADEDFIQKKCAKAADVMAKAAAEIQQRYNYDASGANK